MTTRTARVPNHPGVFRDLVTGEYGFVVGLPAGSGGKRRQARRRGYRTIREAERARDALRVSVADETFVEPDKMTTGEWLTRWLEGRKASLRPRTWERYASLLRVHIAPAIGHVPLQKLTANDLDRLYAALLVDGHQRAKGEPLSPRTVRFVHTVIARPSPTP
jgi:integrase